LDTSQPQEILTTILNGYGVRHKNDELSYRGERSQFSPRKRTRCFQAMLTVNRHVHDRSIGVASLFFEDVAKFLRSINVRYSPAVEFTGKSGFTHRFDFLFRSHALSRERLLKAINNPTRDKASGLLFRLETTQKTYEPANALVYAVPNDVESSLNSNILASISPI